MYAESISCTVCLMRMRRPISESKNTKKLAFGNHLQQKWDFSIACVLLCIPLFAESNRNSLFLAFQPLSDKIPADRTSCIGQITYNSETTDDLMQRQRKKGLLLKTRLKFNPAILKLNRECFTVPLQDIKQQSL